MAASVSVRLVRQTSPQLKPEVAVNIHILYIAAISLDVGSPTSFLVCFVLFCPTKVDLNNTLSTDRDWVWTANICCSPTSISHSDWRDEGLFALCFLTRVRHVRDVC